MYELFYFILSNISSMTGEVVRALRHIEDSSWVRVQDKDIFSRRVTGRPSDEGARSARNEPGKDILILHEEA